MPRAKSLDRTGTAQPFDSCAPKARIELPADREKDTRNWVEAFPTRGQMNCSGSP